MYKEFLEIAENEIEVIRNEYDNLQEEENRTRERLNEISEMRSKLGIPHDCLKSYIAACSSNRYTCPYCFVRGNSSAQVEPIGSNDGTDVFECPHCSLQIEVEIS